MSSKSAPSATALGPSRQPSCKLASTRDGDQLELEAARIRCSMSRKGNCYDNAVAESLFATLKKELVHRTRFRTRAEARSRLFEYIELFYNSKRRHSALGNLSEYERRTKIA